MNAKQRYFDWLVDCIKSRHYPYTYLMRQLFETTFTWFVYNDDNRIDDGLNLRFRFEEETGFDLIRYFDEPCSVLEVMIALAIRLETNIMSNGRLDRTEKWFWQMIKSLGLSHMDDRNYDAEQVDYILQRFLNRQYRPNGEGGLFTVNNDMDMREIEIYQQANLYLSDLIMRGEN